MKDKDVLWSKGKNDEIYTPKYAVLPLVKYIPKTQTIWCPFDTEESNFVVELSKTHNVIYSHIDYGQDFYDYQPCLLYTSPSPRDLSTSRMPSSA